MTRSLGHCIAFHTQFLLCQIAWFPLATPAYLVLIFNSGVLKIYLYAGFRESSREANVDRPARDAKFFVDQLPGKAGTGNMRFQKRTSSWAINCSAVLQSRQPLPQPPSLSHCAPPTQILSVRGAHLIQIGHRSIHPKSLRQNSMCSPVSR